MLRASALLAACAALVLALAGCGDDGGRDAVERYIGEANAVQARFAPDLERANATYADFAEGELDATVADRRLDAAERALRDAGARLERLQPPREAAGMHDRLLRLYAANADFASETTRLGRYLPQARAILRPIDGIGERLRSRLRRAAGPDAQSTALGRYASGVYGQFSRLRRLDPPPVLLATHRAQLARLYESNRLARGLQRATRRRDEKRVARLLLRFRRVTRDAGRAALTRTAVRAYNERYRKVIATATALQREQQRLERRFA